MQIKVTYTDTYVCIHEKRSKQSDPYNTALWMVSYGLLCVCAAHRMDREIRRRFRPTLLLQTDYSSNK